MVQIILLLVLLFYTFLSLTVETQDRDPNHYHK
jgi:hypothetical protein